MGRSCEREVDADANYVLGTFLVVFSLRSFPLQECYWTMTRTFCLANDNDATPIVYYMLLYTRCVSNDPETGSSKY